MNKISNAVKIERTVNEICAEGNLEGYRNILTDIFTDIFSSGCRICAVSKLYPASHLFQESDCLIKIPVESYRANPIEAIWVILHEFGHHQSGEISTFARSNMETEMMREIDAWEHARAYIKFIPQLLDRVEEFEDYASACLKSYQKNHEKYNSR